jgi:endogenous inhibitor of DNA gyrase (YacG/DUF329 family)
MAPDDNPATPLPAPPCPICGKPGVSGHRPFCSARCRNVDLGRWLKGNYRIESDEGPEDGSGESDQ